MTDVNTTDPSSPKQGWGFSLSVDNIMTLVSVALKITEMLVAAAHRAQGRREAIEELSEKGRVRLLEAHVAMNQINAGLQLLTPDEILEELKITGGLRD